MSEQQTRPTEGQVTAGNGPGSHLRDERLRRELTLEEVASRLHLDRATIEKLERDDYPALPPMTFVRGYVRSYSVLLGIDPDPLVARLKQVAPAGEDSTLKAGPGMDSAGNRRKSVAGSAGGRLPVMALSIALLIAVAGTAGWLLSREEADSVVDPSGEDATVSPAETEATEVTEPIQPTEPTEPRSAESPLTEPEPTERESAEPTPSLVAVPVDPTVEAEVGEAAPGMDSPPQTAAIADLLSVPEPDPLNGDSSNATDMAVNLGFVFTGESWVEVTDAQGDRLMFGLVTSGEEQLQGEPPFDIVIGDVSAVSLSYRGEAVDLEQHARGNVARFTLGDS